MRPHIHLISRQGAIGVQGQNLSEILKFNDMAGKE